MAIKRKTNKNKTARPICAKKAKQSNPISEIMNKKLSVHKKVEMIFSEHLPALWKQWNEIDGWYICSTYLEDAKSSDTIVDYRSSYYYSKDVVEVYELFKKMEEAVKKLSHGKYPFLSMGFKSNASLQPLERLFRGFQCSADEYADYDWGDEDVPQPITDELPDLLECSACGDVIPMNFEKGSIGDYGSCDDGITFTCYECYESESE